MWLSHTTIGLENKFLCLTRRATKQTKTFGNVFRYGTPMGIRVSANGPRCMTLDIARE
jgi:hypothetical protein